MYDLTQYELIAALKTAANVLLERESSCPCDDEGCQIMKAIVKLIDGYDKCNEKREI